MKCFKFIAAALLAVPSALAQDATVNSNFQPATLSTADAKNKLSQAGTCVSLPIYGNSSRSDLSYVHTANILSVYSVDFGAGVKQSQLCW